jgi:hypothetical protein
MSRLGKYAAGEERRWKRRGVTTTPTSLRNEADFVAKRRPGNWRQGDMGDHSREGPVPDGCG